MAKSFDVVVIGTGSAASTVASRTKAAGWNVAVIDSRPFGGTCALRGCDPKKVLVGAADVMAWGRRMQGNGVRAGELTIDWPELARFRHTFTAKVPEQRESALARAGIAAYHGTARFVGPTVVQVGDEVLDAKHVVIATGMKPADLGIPGGKLLTTSEQFLERDSLPGRLVIVGGGYIAFEFAHIAVRAGAHVTMVHRNLSPLPRFDRHLVDRLVEATRGLGIRVELGAEVRAVESRDGGFVVRAATQSGELLLEGDMILHAAGRTPELGELDLGRAGIEFDRRGVTVNDFLQSVSNPAVYAAGDAAATAGPPLTPVAGYEGQIVADNLLRGNQKTADYSGIPTVVFTLPPLAAVGMLESEAKEHGLRFRTHTEDTSGWYSSRRLAEPTSGFKLLIEEETERILGAHLIGPHADEMVNFFALAIRRGLTATDFRETIFAYPTQGSDLRSML